MIGGVEYDRRNFNQPVALPEGFSVPKRFDNVSASFLYKHITSGDWSLNQSVRYTRYRTDSSSVDMRDTIDLVGLAAMSSRPGVAWLFGYAYTQKDTVHPLLLPAVLYINSVHSDSWTLVVGFPFLSATFYPHPYWTLEAGSGPGASVSYKVTGQNSVQLMYSFNSWAYRLKGPNVDNVEYSAQRVSLGWSYVYAIDHRTGVVFNAGLGWEFRRRLGDGNKLSMDNAAIMGISASLVFTR